MLQLATVVSTDTTVPQQISDQSPGQEITHKPYFEVQVGDEINAFCGRTYRRCRVIKQCVEGNFVSLTLALVTRSFGRDIAHSRFLGSALAEVYTERTPTQQDNQFLYEKWLLEVIQPGRTYTLLQLSDLIRERFNKRVNKQTLSKAGRQLAKQERLYYRKTGSSVSFRAPLPKTPNLPVVEFAGKASEKLGWITKWQHFHGTNSLQPVVHYLNGHEAFSNEDRLDPANPLQAKQIEVALNRHEGKPIEGLIEISDWTLLELRESWTDRKARTDVMVHLAKLLGYLPETAMDFANRRYADAWNQTLDYLDIYYPHWHQGIRRVS